MGCTQAGGEGADADDSTPASMAGDGGQGGADGGLDADSVLGDAGRDGGERDQGTRDGGRDASGDAEGQVDAADPSEVTDAGDLDASDADVSEAPVDAHADAGEGGVDAEGDADAGGSSGSSCSYDTECPAEQWCRGDQCVDNDYCEDDAGCSGDEVCDTQRAHCTTCTADAHCPAGHHCVDAEVCEPFDTCVNALDCPLGWVCEAGECLDCVDDDDCDDGEICAHASCRTACDSDTDCTPVGELCREEPGIEGYCASCKGDLDCPAAQFCDAGECVPDVCVAGEMRCDEGYSCAVLNTDVYPSSYDVVVCPSATRQDLCDSGCLLSYYDEVRTVATCNEAGSGFVTELSCEASSSCVQGGGTASCEARTCTGSCSEDYSSALPCSDDGLVQYGPILCPPGTACEAGACEFVMCTPGSTTCNEATGVLNFCNAQGTSFTDDCSGLGCPPCEE